jgi:hypothetical protein
MGVTGTAKNATLPAASTRERLLDDLETALATGMTLPPSWYTDPEVLSLELEHVFRHSTRIVSRSPAISLWLRPAQSRWSWCAINRGSCVGL